MFSPLFLNQAIKIIYQKKLTNLIKYFSFIANSVKSMNSVAWGQSRTKRLELNCQQATLVAKILTAALKNLKFYKLDMSIKFLLRKLLDFTVTF